MAYYDAYIAEVQRSHVLVDAVDFFRLDATRRLELDRRAEFGQFMTPPSTARLMASMFVADSEHLSLLDAGAGVGSLTAAFIGEICERPRRPSSIHVTAYEIDKSLAKYLKSTLDQCRAVCQSSGIEFECELVESDFIEDGTRSLRHEMFMAPRRFDCAILNSHTRKSIATPDAISA